MSLIVLDTTRLHHNRLDCLPCVRVPYRDTSGNWVYDDVSEDEDSYEPLNPSPDGRSGVLGGLGNLIPGLRGARSAQQGSSQDPGDMYYAPQQQQVPTSAAAAAENGAVDEIGVQQQQQQGLGSHPRGSRHAAGVLPGVTHQGPGLLHGDKVSLQSLLQVSVVSLSSMCH